MKKILILLAGLLLLAGCSQKEVRIPTEDGTLVLQPLLDNAIRVRLEPADYQPLPAMWKKWRRPSSTSPRKTGPSR